MIPVLGRSPGEENGNPLQYSGLENPMDGGTWKATVHGVAKTQTQLIDFISLTLLSIHTKASVVVQTVKNLPVMQETQV